MRKQGWRDRKEHKEFTQGLIIKSMMSKINDEFGEVDINNI